jgi:hypothetical protein
MMHANGVLEKYATFYQGDFLLIFKQHGSCVKFVLPLVLMLIVNQWNQECENVVQRLSINMPTNSVFINGQLWAWWSCRTLTVVTWNPEEANFYIFCILEVSRCNLPTCGEHLKEVFFYCMWRSAWFVLANTMSVIHYLKVGNLNWWTKFCLYCSYSNLEHFL